MLINVLLGLQALSALLLVFAKKAQRSFNRATPASSIHMKVAHLKLTAERAFLGLIALLSTALLLLGLAMGDTSVRKAQPPPNVKLPHLAPMPPWAAPLRSFANLGRMLRKKG